CSSARSNGGSRLPPPFDVFGLRRSTSSMRCATALPPGLDRRSQLGQLGTSPVPYLHHVTQGRNGSATGARPCGNLVDTGSVSVFRPISEQHPVRLRTEPLYENGRLPTGVQLSSSAHSHAKR